MALDPRIILGGQAPQIEGPLDTYGKVLSLKSLMDQNAMNKLKMQKAERGIADEQDLRNLARQAGGDQNKLRELLNQSGRFKEARAIEESGLKLDDTRADIAKKTADTANTTSQMTERDWKLKKDRLATIRSQGQGTMAIYQQFIDKGMSDQQARAASQPYYDRAVQEIAQSGLFDETELSKMPKQFDPRLVMQGVQGTLEGDKYLDNLRGDKQLVETARHNRTSEGLTARGQNMTDARGAETNRLKAQEIAAGGKPPAGFRFMADGNLEAIPGGPADPNNQKKGAPTEDERKAAGWLSQANNAYKNMTDAMRESPGSEAPGMWEAANSTMGLDGLANLARTPGRQKFTQASSSLSEALLRAATGAGVNRDEAKQKVQEISPLWTDSAAVKKQKMDSIPVYLESLRTRAGRAAPQEAPIQPAQSPQQSSGSIGGWSIQKVE